MSDERAQTTFDFAVGITLFLLVVGFAFTAAPSLLAPYQGSGESEAILADRAADYLTTDRLAADERYELDSEEVDSLFPETAGEPSDSLKADLGVGDEYGLNVTLALDSGTCPGEPTDDKTCELGDAPPADATVSRSTRVVSVGGTRADLTVRVWK